MIVNNDAQVAILMGSKSDWPVMEHAATTLDKFNIAYEANVISAHRCHDHLVEYLNTVNQRELKAIICGAGLAAHLAGVVASKTIIPVLAVPMDAKPLDGLDALLSTVQMPGGIPVATFAIGKPGVVNAALFATSIIAREDVDVRGKLSTFRADQTAKLTENTDPRG